MNPIKRKALIIAAACVVGGLLISFLALAALDFNFFEMGTMDAVTNTYEVAEAFRNIWVHGSECDIRLLPSEDGTCRVVCNETDRITHTVAVQNGTLTIHRTDDRRWFEHIGFTWRYWKPIEVIIYLPETTYEDLDLRTVSGYVEVPDDFNFVKAEVNSTSGNIKFTAAVQGDLFIQSVSGNIYVGDIAPKTLTLKASSGDIAVESVTVSGEFSCQTISGQQEISDVFCQNATIYATSGDVTMEAVKAQKVFNCQTISGQQRVRGVGCQSAVTYATSGDMTYTDLQALEDIRMESVSGDVRLIRCDADSLWLKSVSGNVSGSLRTEKVFVTRTVSGSVSVPGSTTGGTCEVTTTSGDIRFELVDE